MSVTNLGPWIEASQRPRLESDTPVSRLMSAAPRLPNAFEDAARGVPSVHALTTVSEATHLMASQGVLRVHVRDNHGKVVGVLTVSDLFRWVTASHSEDDDAPTAGHA